MSSTGASSQNYLQDPSNGRGAVGSVPPSPSSPGKSAPPPPYSEYQVSTGVLNSVNPYATSSSQRNLHPALAHPGVHPTSSSYLEPHGMPYQHVQAPPHHPAVPVPVIVVQPSTPGLPHSPPPGHFPQFGPTPLTDSQVLLPYGFYTERAIVDARARWRFLEAFFCAIGVYLGIALLVGVEGFGDGWWTFYLRNGNWATS